MRNWIIAIAVLISLLQSAIAQKSGVVEMRPTEHVSEITLQSTLDDLLVYAAMHNPQLSAAYYRWRAAVEKIPEVSALPEPRLSYGYFIRGVETRVGPQKQKIGISQTFPFIGKLGLKEKIQLRAAKADSSRIEAERLRIFFQVKSNWYEYAYLLQAQQVLAENVELLGLLEGVVRAKYRAGSTPYSSLIKIQVELDRLLDRQKDLVDMVRPVTAQINAVLNRPPQSILPVPGEIPVRDIENADTAWVAWLQQHNPDLEADRLQIKMREAGVDLAKRRRYPDLTIGLDYVNTSEALNPNLADSGKDPLMVMASVNIPLWRGKNNARIATAEAEYRTAMYQLNTNRNNLLARQEMVLYRFREAKRKVDLYTNSLIPRTEQALNVSRSAFEAGEVDILELIDAQRTMLEFELLLEREKANLQQRLSELEMLAGKEL